MKSSLMPGRNLHNLTDTTLNWMIFQHLHQIKRIKKGEKDGSDSVQMRPEKKSGSLLLQTYKKGSPTTGKMINKSKPVGGEPLGPLKEPSLL